MLIHTPDGIKSTNATPPKKTEGVLSKSEVKRLYESVKGRPCTSHVQRLCETALYAMETGKECALDLEEVRRNLNKALCVCAKMEARAAAMREETKTPSQYYNVEVA